MLFDNDREKIVAIVRGIEAGNPEDIERLHTFLRRGLTLFLKSRLRSAEVEDLFSDTFLEVVTAIRKKKIRSPESIAAFAVTIAQRRVVKSIRERIRERRTVQLDKAVEDLVAGPHGEDVLLYDERKEVMNTAFTALSARDREILQRFYLLYQPPLFIQREMCLTETQYRLLKSRAKAKLLAVCQAQITGSSRKLVSRAISRRKLSRLDGEKSQSDLALCPVN